MPQVQILKSVPPGGWCRSRNPARSQCRAVSSTESSHRLFFLSKCLLVERNHSFVQLCEYIQARAVNIRVVPHRNERNDRAERMGGNNRLPNPSGKESAAWRRIKATPRRPHSPRGSFLVTAGYLSAAGTLLHMRGMPRQSYPAQRFGTLHSSGCCGAFLCARRSRIHES